MRTSPLIGEHVQWHSSPIIKTGFERLRGLEEIVFRPNTALTEGHCLSCRKQTVGYAPKSNSSAAAHVTPATEQKHEAPLDLVPQENDDGISQLG
jgi:hypothetical protein